MDNFVLFNLSMPGFSCADLLGNFQNICVSKKVSTVYYTGSLFASDSWLQYTQSVTSGDSQRSVRRCSSFTVSRGPRLLVQCVAVDLKNLKGAIPLGVFNYLLY